MTKDWRADPGKLCFSGNPLDRASARRSDDAWLAAQRVSGLCMVLWQGKPLVKNDRAVFLPWQSEWDSAVFLGLDGTQALFAVELGCDSEPVMDGVFMEMRAAAFALPARDVAIAGQAKALLDWHRRHGFCPNCGTKTDMRDGGYRRVCPACGAEHFPRTDPVVIMLPIFKSNGFEDKCLIGRNARFVGGLYSAFAGFVEPGETVEEAVARELMEEVNLAVTAVRYHKSQPWPFPSSLMIGCYADAASMDFHIDGVEIADARWLTKSEARARLAGEIEDEMKMPGTIAIARHLMQDWVAG